MFISQEGWPAQLLKLYKCQKRCPRGTAAHARWSFFKGFWLARPFSRLCCWQPFSTHLLPGAILFQGLLGGLLFQGPGSTTTCSHVKLFQVDTTCLSKDGVAGALMVLVPLDGESHQPQSWASLMMSGWSSNSASAPSQQAQSVLPSSPHFVPATAGLAASFFKDLPFSRGLWSWSCWRHPFSRKGFEAFQLLFQFSFLFQGFSWHQDRFGVGPGPKLSLFQGLAVLLFLLLGKIFQLLLSTGDRLFQGFQVGSQSLLGGGRRVRFVQRKPLLLLPHLPPVPCGGARPHSPPLVVVVPVHGSTLSQGKLLDLCQGRCRPFLKGLQSFLKPNWEIWLFQAHCGKLTYTEVLWCLL